MRIKTLDELIQAWKVGAKVGYTYKGGDMIRPIEKLLPAYDESKLEGLTALFYREGVKFKVFK